MRSAFILPNAPEDAEYLVTTLYLIQRTGEAFLPLHRPMKSSRFRAFASCSVRLVLLCVFSGVGSGSRARAEFVMFAPDAMTLSPVFAEKSYLSQPGIALLASHLCSADEVFPWLSTYFELRPVASRDGRLGFGCFEVTYGVQPFNPEIPWHRNVRMRTQFGSWK